MFLQFLLFRPLYASDDHHHDRRIRICEDSETQRCYLWDPYASTQEVSRSFSNLSEISDLSTTSISSQPWAIPNINYSFETSTESILATKWRVTRKNNDPRPLYITAPPPLPNGTPRSLEEYAKLLPISMFFNAL